MISFNLKTRLSLIISSVIALLVLATGFVVMAREQRHLIDEDHQKTLILASSFATQCREPLLMNNIYQLYIALTDFLVQQSGHFSYVEILNPDGTIIIHNNLAMIGQTNLSSTGLRAREISLPEVIHAPRKPEGPSFDDILSPVIIGQVRIGALILGHSHYPIELEIAKVKQQIFLIGFLATIIGILLANLLAARLAAPLRQLTEATERIARGERDLTVNITRRDEFGILARAFQRMAQELKKTTVSRDSIQKILDSAGDAIRFIDREKQTLRTNRAMTNLLGREVLPDTPAHCTVLLKGDFCDSEYCLLRRIEKGEEYIRIQASVTLMDGRSIFASIIATPVIEHGELVGIIESIQDISEWKKAEEARRMLENQFLQSQKMETVGRLASGVAHDFNNILTVIIGYTGILQKKFEDNGQTKEILQIIYDAGGKAAALTRQLLAFSRKQVLAVEPIDLRIVIDQLTKMLRRLLGEDIKLTVLDGDELYYVLADTSQIEQILMNLVVNARDAMPNGGELTIKTENWTTPAGLVDGLHEEIPDGDYVLLSVTDNGTGIPKEIAEQIFEPFFTTKDKGHGTGLGLSTVYGIVKQHKGYISVTSEPGQGTTFNIYLPASMMGEHAVFIKTTAGGPRYGTESILVVDDDETVQLVVTEMLSMLGYTIVTAGDAREALNVFGSRHFDLMITDLTMPGQTGWELAHEIIKINPDIKIIFMSGYVEIDQARAELFQKSIFLQKPLAIDTILAAIADILDSDIARKT
ncbi:MAG: hypothetical protein A2521_09245 [Deltaproteobacteria bacterium RIFOXYD12_FULL_57_12]|nr:MAG: hypothetical protein A2521_09245 [Deltaproteobacteria bacterium RIFOXYD12_FULL_57_12]